MAAAPPELAPHRRVAAALSGALVLLAALRLLAPVASDPLGQMLGLPEGEAASHLWGLGTTARGMLAHGPFLRVSALADAPVGVRLDLVDPLHALLLWPLEASLGRAWPGLGVLSLGWNLLHLAWLLVLAGGTLRLARVLGAPPMGRVLALAGTLGAPYLWAGLPLGRSELLGLLILPLLLSALAQALRAPPGPAGRAPALGAAACLLALVLCGWQPLLFGLLALVPAALILAWGQPLRASAGRLAGVLLPAVLLSLPMLWVQLGTAPWWTERLAGQQSLRGSPGLDLLAALRLEGLLPPPGGAVPPYPGLGLALLCLGGLLPRRSRAWSLLALGLVLLSLGPRLILGEGLPPLLGPTRLLLVFLPWLGGLSDWARLSLVAAPLCALAGGLALGPRLRPAPTALLAALLLLDGMSWRQAGPQAFPSAPPPALAGLVAGLPEGPILELPGSAPTERDRLGDNDRSLLWTLAHGRPVTAVPSPGGSSLLGRTFLLELHRLPAGGGDRGCEAGEGARLFALGMRSVLLHEARLEAARLPGYVQRLEQILGPPTARADGLRAWVLAPGDLGPARCQPHPPPARGPGPP